MSFDVRRGVLSKAFLTPHGTEVIRLAVVHLVYGGDWGIRLKPEDSEEEWDLRSSDQWGEPYLMLTDAGDIILEA